MVKTISRPKSFSRKDLKDQDKFASGASRFASWMLQRRRRLGLIALIVVAAASLLVGFLNYRQRQEGKAAAALAQALRLYAAPVGTAAPDDTALSDVRFKTDEDRLAAAVTAFEEVSAEYGRYPSGQVATFYRGSTLAEQGRDDEAITVLDGLTNASVPLVRSVATYRLGQLYARTDRVDEALALFDRLSRDGATGVPTEEALAAKARAFETAGDLQAAMLAYQQISVEHANTSHAARARVRIEELAAELGLRPVDLENLDGGGAGGDSG